MVALPRLANDDIFVTIRLPSPTQDVSARSKSVAKQPQKQVPAQQGRAERVTAPTDFAAANAPGFHTSTRTR